jgi:hypothetical protein
MRELMTAQRRRPRIPSIFSTLSISNPPNTIPSQRGRAYRPSHIPASIKIRFAFSLFGSNHIDAIIQNYGVFRFGKKEPAFDYEAERRTRNTEPGHDSADHSLKH